MLVWTSCTVATSKLTTVEVQWLSTMAKAVVMCGDEATLATPTAEAATGTTASLAGMLGKVRHQLVKKWRPSSTAPLWVCKEHQTPTALSGKTVTIKTQSKDL